MAINKKLIHFNKKEDFNKELESGNILDKSIVFIKDSNQIYTHGKFYDGASPNWEAEEGEAGYIENKPETKTYKITNIGLTVIAGYVNATNDVRGFTNSDKEAIEAFIKNNEDLQKTILNTEDFNVDVLNNKVYLKFNFIGKYIDTYIYKYSYYGLQGEIEFEYKNNVFSVNLRNPTAADWNDEIGGSGYIKNRPFYDNNKIIESELFQINNLPLKWDSEFYKGYGINFNNQLPVIVDEDFDTSELGDNIFYKVSNYDEIVAALEDDDSDIYITIAGKETKLNKYTQTIEGQTLFLFYDAEVEDINESVILDSTILFSLLFTEDKKGIAFGYPYFKYLKEKTSEEINIDLTVNSKKPDIKKIDNKYLDCINRNNKIKSSYLPNNIGNFKYTEFTLKYYPFNTDVQTLTFDKIFNSEDSDLIYANLFNSIVEGYIIKIINSGYGRPSICMSQDCVNYDCWLSFIVVNDSSSAPLILQYLKFNGDEKTVEIYTSVMENIKK